MPRVVALVTLFVLSCPIVAQETDPLPVFVQGADATHPPPMAMHPTLEGWVILRSTHYTITGSANGGVRNLYTRLQAVIPLEDIVAVELVLDNGIVNGMALIQTRHGASYPIGCPDRRGSVNFELPGLPEANMWSVNDVLTFIAANH